MKKNNIKRNKLFMMGTLVVMLAFGLVLAGCGDGGEGKPDTWGTVSGFDQLTGTWNGAYSIASKDLTELMEGLMEDLDDPQFEIIKPMIQGVRVSMGVDMTIRVDNDAAKKTATATIINARTTMTFSGKNAPMILQMIGALLDPNPSIPGLLPVPVPELPEGIVPRIDGDKLIIAATNFPLSELDTDNKETMAILNENFEINQDGTKIKVKMPEDTPAGLLPEEFILTKR
ncbi:MAG: hypothetical protein LBH75_03915 [Treponema sp.]|jgi:hypothetical protein|nr:hypothetical protein [Treponema sp.]